MTKIKPIYIVAAVATLAVTIWATSPTPEPKRPEKKERARGAAKSAKADTFTEEDYKAKFARLAVQPKSVFQPLVLGAASGDRLAPNEIPSAFCGGSGRWSYTGTVIIDGAPQALVESAETGEGEFIKVGQAWKTSKVIKITPTSLVLEGPNGSIRSLDLMRDPVDASGSLMSPSVRPVSPVIAQNQPSPDQNRGQNDGRGRRDGQAAMSGPIGGGPVTFTPPQGAPAPGGGAEFSMDLGGFVPDDTVIDLTSSQQQ